MTWQDYVFRPFWLKVPLEVAALIVVIGIVMRGEHPLPTQQIARRELASAADGDTDKNRADTTSDGGGDKDGAGWMNQEHWFWIKLPRRRPQLLKSLKRNCHKHPHHREMRKKILPLRGRMILPALVMGAGLWATSAVGEMAAGTDDQKTVRAQRGCLDRPRASARSSIGQPPPTSPMVSLIGAPNLAQSKTARRR